MPFLIGMIFVSLFLCVFTDGVLAGAGLGALIVTPKFLVGRVRELQTAFKDRANYITWRDTRRFLGA